MVVTSRLARRSRLPALTLIALLGAGLVMACRGMAAAEGHGSSILFHNPPAVDVIGKQGALYRALFQFIDDGKFARAERLRAQLSDADLDKWIEWRLLARGNAGKSFGEIRQFLTENPHFPGKKTLSKRIEEAMTDDLPDADILTWFRRTAPATVDGARRLIEAYGRSGQSNARLELIRRNWINGNFGPRQERQFFRRYKADLTANDHWQRLDRLLWEGRFAPAHRMLRLVNREYQLLARARIALRRHQGGVDYALSRVPENLKQDPGLIYERVRWRRVKERDEEAINMLFDHARDGEDGSRPHLWWRERAILTRRSLNAGAISTAYRLAEDHGQTAAVHVAEAEWLAGWIALRWLQDPATALTHFQNLYDVVRLPLSLSRGAYWTGRAAEAMGDEAKARNWYGKAAKYNHTYYGQLALTKLDREPETELPQIPPPTAAETADFEALELVRIAHKLGALGLDQELRAIILKLGYNARQPAQFSLVMDLARNYNRLDLVIFAAIRALSSGEFDFGAAYPLHPAVGDNTVGDRALVLAVMRKESTFNSRAKSRAGALGLMQLMPATASLIARDLGLVHRVEDLIGEPAYNVHLGSAYLDRMVRRWDGSYVLAVASYNAGPGRVKSWIERFGDPREADVDVIDWVETIPFQETRNYVQRVLESTTIYRKRLGQPELASLAFVLNTQPD